MREVAILDQRVITGRAAWSTAPSQIKAPTGQSPVGLSRAVSLTLASYGLLGPCNCVLDAARSSFARGRQFKVRCSANAPWGCKKPQWGKISASGSPNLELPAIDGLEIIMPATSRAL